MIFVLADDITGAAEIAGICLRYGIEVSFGIDSIPKKEATVNIIATDTRSMNEDEAYKTHLRLAKEINLKSDNIIFKKCDSVIRGHILAELLAVLEVTEKSSVLLQPANPEGNRCIRNSSYWVNNILIENTGFAVDPDFPAKTSLVKNLILDGVEKENSIEVNTGTFKEINSKGIFIPDCDSVSTLSECINLYNKDSILAGSGAFFEQFLIKRKLEVSKIDKKEHYYSRDYILLSGSTHPESIQFSKKLEKVNCPLITFPEILLEDALNEDALKDFIIKISSVYKEHKKVTLRISNEIIHFKNKGLNIKNRMSLIAKSIVEDSNINNLFIEGGATAYDLLNELNWKSFTPIEELDSGVVRMQYDNDTNKQITIKPGSYKWPIGLLN